VSRDPATRAVTLAVLIGAGYMFPLYLVGAVGVSVRADLGLSVTQLGAVVSVFFGTGAVLLPFGGRVVDRMGPGRSARLAVAGAAACLAAVALFGGTYPGLLAAMAVGGLGSTVAAPVGGTIIARVVPAGRRPLAFAVERSSIPAATLLAGVSVPTLAAVLPWRAVFGIGAVLVVSILFLRVPAVPWQGRPPADRGRLRPLTPLLLVTAMFVLGSAAATALSTFFVGHAVRLGMADGLAGIALAATSAATIGVRMVLGLLGARVPGRVTSAALLLAGAAGFALLAVPALPAAWAGALLAGAAGWGWTGVLGLAVVQSHPDAPGASTALVQAGGCAGGIAGPLLVGWLAERHDYPVSWLALALLAAVAGLVAAVNGGIWRWVSHAARPAGVDPCATADLTSERTGVSYSGTRSREPRGLRCRTDR
jgi:MFS family permease